MTGQNTLLKRVELLELRLYQTQRALRVEQPKLPTGLELLGDGSAADEIARSIIDQVRREKVDQYTQLPRWPQVVSYDRDPTKFGVLRSGTRFSQVQADGVFSHAADPFREFLLWQTTWVDQYGRHMWLDLVPPDVQAYFRALHADLKIDLAAARARARERGEID